MILFYVYECFTCMNACALPVYIALGGQKRVLNPLELELQTVVSL